MAIEVLHDTNKEEACMYCSVSDTAFGPVFRPSEDRAFDAGEECEAFLQWLLSGDGTQNPRIMSSVELHWFRRQFADVTYHDKLRLLGRESELPEREAARG